MTVEQMQALLETVRDTQNRLVSMMTALAFAIELFDGSHPPIMSHLVTALAAASAGAADATHRSSRPGAQGVAAG